MATYIRLTDYKSSDEKEKGFFKPENRYEAKQKDFEKIPGSPIAYWVSERVKEIFENIELNKIAEPRVGLQTSDNNRFLRFWFETEFNNIGFKFENREIAKNSKLKWFPYNKGGDFRKWFGNNEIIVNWENDGYEIREYNNFLNKTRSSNIGIANTQFYFKSSITWSFVSSFSFGVRYSEKGYIFDTGGSSLFVDENKLLYFTAFMCSKIAFNLLRTINPTLNFQPGNIGKLPIIFPKSESTKQKIDQLTQECIDISKEEWDSRETSWDFTKNELIKHKTDSKIETAYKNYCNYWREKFYKLHKNEEELNIFTPKGSIKRTPTRLL
jgi:hypothetical protein